MENYEPPQALLQLHSINICGFNVSHAAYLLLCVCVYCVYKAQLDCTLNKSGPIHDRRQMYLSSFLILMNQLQNLSQTLRLTDVQCCWHIRCILGNTLFERDLHTN